MKLIIEFYHEKQKKYVKRTLWGSLSKPTDAYITNYVIRNGGNGVFKKTVEHKPKPEII